MIPRPDSSWREAAECRGHSITSFFVESKKERYSGLGWEPLCGRCPVRADCLAHALVEDERWGVWGGLTPRARRQVGDLLQRGAVTWPQVAASLNPQPRAKG